MKNLKQLRERSGYSQKELAEILEVTQSFISKLENNNVDCTVSFAKRVAYVLKTDLFKLIQK